MPTSTAFITPSDPRYTKTVHFVNEECGRLDQHRGDYERLTESNILYLVEEAYSAMKMGNPEFEIHEDETSEDMIDFKKTITQHIRRELLDRVSRKLLERLDLDTGSKNLKKVLPLDGDDYVKEIRALTQFLYNQPIVGTRRNGKRRHWERPSESCANGPNDWTDGD